MAYVSFKRGTQDALTKYLYTYTGSDAIEATEGTFYLTEDTNRLYIGKDVSSTSTPNIKAVPVNQGAIPVDTVHDLPIPSAAVSGQFYYVITGNILCVSSGNNWVQINTDTNTDNFIDERQITSTNDTTNHKAVITDILYNKNNSQILSEYDFVGANGFDVSVAPVYELAKRYVAGTTYYTLSGGTYSEASNVTSIANNNSTYYIRRGYSLTLTPATYTISSSVTSNNLTIGISDGGSNSSSVVINHGTNNTFTESNGTITFNSSNDTVDSLKSGPGNGPNNNVSYDGNGNVTGVTHTTHGFYVQVHNTNNATAGASFDPQIKVGSAAANQQTVQFDNGVATLPVYTTTEVDNKLRLFNAMEYQGVANSSTFDTSATDVKNGYVWMAENTITLDATSNPPLTAKPGDLIIAQGTEESNGYILPANIQWQVVTSGTSFDTQPTMDVSATYANGFAVGKSVASGGNAVIGVFQIAVNSTTAADGEYLTATETINGTTKVVRIVHNLTNATTSADTSHTNASGASIIQGSATSMGSSGKSTMDIPVPVVTYDKAGHITGITTYLYQVTDSHANITNHTLVATSSASTAATITNQFQVDGQNVTATMGVNSNTINLSANNGALVMNIEWGTFN